MENVINWLEEVHPVPIFVDMSGLSFLFICASIGICVAIAMSKKVRNIFFLEVIMKTLLTLQIQKSDSVVVFENCIVNCFIKTESDFNKTEIGRAHV